MLRFEFKNSRSRSKNRRRRPEVCLPSRKHVLDAEGRPRQHAFRLFPPIFGDGPRKTLTLSFSERICGLEEWRGRARGRGDRRPSERRRASRSAAVVSCERKTIFSPLYSSSSSSSSSTNFSIKQAPTLFLSIFSLFLEITAAPCRKKERQNKLIK